MLTNSNSRRRSRSYIEFVLFPERLAISRGADPQRIVHRLWQDSFNRHVVLVVALKFTLLALLWWFFVREYRSDPDSSGIAQALLPTVPSVVETQKDPAP